MERPVTISAARGATPLTSPVNIKDRDVLSARQSELGWKTVPISKGNTEETCERCHIQCNVRASSETKKHTVVWSWDDRPGSQLTGGSGYGGDFVRSMKAGDRVAVVARAMVGIHQPYSKILLQSTDCVSIRVGRIMCRRWRWKFITLFRRLLHIYICSLQHVLLAPCSGTGATLNNFLTFSYIPGCVWFGLVGNSRFRYVCRLSDDCGPESSQVSK